MRDILSPIKLQSEIQKSCLAYTKPAPNQFVTWECTDKSNYFWGHYFSNLLSAQKDFCARGLDKVQFYEQAKKRKEPEPER